MAVIEEAVESRLSGWTALTDLVGTRIHPVRLPQVSRTSDGLPALSYTRASSVRVHSHQGGSGLAAPVFQFDAWASDYSTAKAVINEVRKALVGFRGTVDGVRIDAGLAQSERDEFEDDTGIYRTTIDIRVWHGE